MTALQLSNDAATDSLLKRSGSVLLAHALSESYLRCLRRGFGRWHLVATRDACADVRWRARYTQGLHSLGHVSAQRDARRRAHAFTAWYKASFRVEACKFRVNAVRIQQSSAARLLSRSVRSHCYRLVRWPCVAVVEGPTT